MKLSQSQRQSAIADASSILLMGIPGLDLTPDLHPLVKQVGGIILFDKNLHGGIKNIQSPQQVKALIAACRELNPNLWVAVDHEGGADREAVGIRQGVTRLKPSYGFFTTQSARQVGELFEQGKFDDCQRACDDNAKLLHELGFNLVFAPCVDQHDPNCPIIGAINRAYSDDMTVITRLAAMQIAAFQAQGIQSCLKHYPGHGRSSQDSHHGITDISATWQQQELSVYQACAQECGMVMLGHLMLSQVDSDFPASVSAKHVAACRETFDGVIICDDMQMTGLIESLTHRYRDQVEQLSQADRDRFLFEKSLEHAINAGVTMLMFCNQMVAKQPQDFYQQYLDSIIQLLEQEKISLDQLHAAAAKIQSLKSLQMFEKPAIMP